MQCEWHPPIQEGLRDSNVLVHPEVNEIRCMHTSVKCFASRAKSSGTGAGSGSSSVGGGRLAIDGACDVMLTMRISTLLCIDIEHARVPHAGRTLNSRTYVKCSHMRIHTI